MPHTFIDPLAHIEKGAQLGHGVSIGAFAYIGGQVQLGDGCQIQHHASVTGHTTLGANNVVFPFASLGSCPQDKKYGGEATTLTIGNGNTFRENVTVNTGTVQDRGDTAVGDDNWIMAYVHIAHDCVVGNHTEIANATQLAGHVEIGDHAKLAGFCAVHQFCRVGAHSMLGIGSVITQDVLPYVLVGGQPTKAYGINHIGLKRRGFSEDSIRRIKQAYKILFLRQLSLEEACQQLEQQASTETQQWLDFLRHCPRGFIHA